MWGLPRWHGEIYYKVTLVKVAVTGRSAFGVKTLCEQLPGPADHVLSS